MNEKKLSKSFTVELEPIKRPDGSWLIVDGICCFCSTICDRLWIKGIEFLKEKYVICVG